MRRSMRIKSAAPAKAIAGLVHFCRTGEGGGGGGGFIFPDATAYLINI